MRALAVAVLLLVGHAVWAQENNIPSPQLLNKAPEYSWLLQPTPTDWSGPAKQIGVHNIPLSQSYEYYLHQIPLSQGPDHYLERIPKTEQDNTYEQLSTLMVEVNRHKAPGRSSGSKSRMNGRK
jgi:hypothetical protein